LSKCFHDNIHIKTKWCAFHRKVPSQHLNHHDNWIIQAKNALPISGRSGIIEEKRRSIYAVFFEQGRCGLNLSPWRIDKDDSEIAMKSKSSILKRVWYRPPSISMRRNVRMGSNENRQPSEASEWWAGTVIKWIAGEKLRH
jgi:hypothetical protein